MPFLEWKSAEPSFALPIRGPIPIQLATVSDPNSRNHVFERSAVQDERSILQAAISRSMVQTTYEQVRHEFAQRVQRGEFLAVGHGEGRAAPLYTTAEVVRMEQEIIGRMQSGNQRTYRDPMLVSPPLRIAIEDRNTELSPAQLRVVDDIFVSREKIVGLDGIAGTGKTCTAKVASARDARIPSLS